MDELLTYHPKPLDNEVYDIIGKVVQKIDKNPIQSLKLLNIVLEKKSSNQNLTILEQAFWEHVTIGKINRPLEPSNWL